MAGYAVQKSLGQRLQSLVKRTVCRHQWRPSLTWPGAVVCERCGRRSMPRHIV